MISRSLWSIFKLSDHWEKGMSDWKDKLPSFKELSSMTMKFVKDMGRSVHEIVDEYQDKRKEKTEEAPPKKDEPKA